MPAESKHFLTNRPDTAGPDQGCIGDGGADSPLLQTPETNPTGETDFGPLFVGAGSILSPLVGLEERKGSASEKESRKGDDRKGDDGSFFENLQRLSLQTRENLRDQLSFVLGQLSQLTRKDLKDLGRETLALGTLTIAGATALNFLVSPEVASATPEVIQAVQEISANPASWREVGEKVLEFLLSEPIVYLWVPPAAGVAGVTAAEVIHSAIEARADWIAVPGQSPIDLGLYDNRVYDPSSPYHKTGTPTWLFWPLPVDNLREGLCYRIALSHFVAGTIFAMGKNLDLPVIQLASILPTLPVYGQLLWREVFRRLEQHTICLNPLGFIRLDRNLRLYYDEATKTWKVDFDVWNLDHDEPEDPRQVMGGVWRKPDFLPNFLVPEAIERVEVAFRGVAGVMEKVRYAMRWIPHGDTIKKVLNKLNEGRDLPTEYVLWGMHFLDTIHEEILVLNAKLVSDEIPNFNFNEQRWWRDIGDYYRIVQHVWWAFVECVKEEKLDEVQEIGLQKYFMPEETRLETRKVQLLAERNRHKEGSPGWKLAEKEIDRVRSNMHKLYLAVNAWKTGLNPENQSWPSLVAALGSTLERAGTRDKGQIGREHFQTGVYIPKYQAWLESRGKKKRS